MPRNKTHYAWFILAGCCIINAALPGITLACTGVFYRPISDTLGIGLADVALYSTFMTFARMLGLPIIGKTMPKYDIRLSLFVITLLMCGGFAMLSLVNSRIMLYAIGIVVGMASGGALYMAMPTLLGAWFKERLGFAMGLAASCSGIGAAIFNPIASNLAGFFGWRSATVIMGAIAFLLVLPTLVFVLRSNPASKGLAPFGANDYADAQGSAEQSTSTPQTLTGITAKESWRAPTFYMAMILVSAVGYITSFQNHMATFAISAGVPAAQSGFAASVCSVGTIIAAPILGMLNDKFGPARAAGTFALFAIISSGLGLFAGANPTLVFVSVFVLGWFMPLLTVQMPLITRTVFGTKEFSVIFSRIMSVNSFVTGVGVFAIGALYDVAGEAYTYHFYIAAALAFAYILVVGPIVRMGKKMLSQPTVNQPKQGAL